MNLLARAIKQARADNPAPPNILRTLFAVQAALGYVPVESVPEIARELGVAEADVAGVLSFYPDLRTTRPGAM